MLVGTCIVCLGTLVVTWGTVASIRSSDKATGSIQSATEDLKHRSAELQIKTEQINRKSEDIHAQTDALKVLSSQILTRSQSLEGRTEALEQRSEALATQLTSVEDKTAVLKQTADRIEGLTTGGDSHPTLFPGITTDPENPNQAFVNLTLNVQGKNPLRNLNVGISRITHVDSDPAKQGWGGAGIYNQHFETLAANTMDLRTAFRGDVIKANKAVFYMNASALNGSWSEIIRVVRVGEAWEYWLVLFDYVGSASQPNALINFHSAGFPPDELKKPFARVTPEDIYTAASPPL